MKNTSFPTKVISLFLALILCVGIMGTAVFAADDTVTKNLSGKYGDIVPTDKELKAQKTSYSFYGDSTTLYFMLFSQGKANSYCAVRIYSDSQYSDESLVTSYSNSLGASGSQPLSVNWNFKSLNSGVYYGKSYIYRTDGETVTVDSSTVRTFKVTINRIGKKTVELAEVAAKDGYVLVSWKALKTATSYRIYRKLSGETSWTTLKTVKGGNTSYKDTTVKSGKTYYYTVKAFDGSVTSKYNKTGLSTLYLSTPQLGKMTVSGTAGYAKVSWGKVSGAKGYYVYRKGGSLSNSSWTKIASVGSTVTSYVDKSATSADWKYQYTVIAYNGSYRSAHNKDGVSYNALKVPSLSSAKADDGTITITWKDSNTLTQSYAIYRKDNTSTSWKKIGTSTKKKFVDENIASGKTYTYTVRAVAETNMSGYKSAGITLYYLAAPELVSTALADNGNITVKWKAVDGATAYAVYRKINGGNWVKLTTVNGNTKVSFADTVAKISGDTYTYTVKALNGSYESAYNKDGISTVYLSTPELTLTNEETSVTLTWEEIEGAVSYKIYKKIDGESAWTVLDVVNESTSYSDYEIANGEKASYAVRAISEDGCMSRYKAKTNIFVDTPVIEDAVLGTEGVTITWNAIEGADTYYVYRKTADGEFTLIGSYSQNEYLDSDASVFTTPYLYTVRASVDSYVSADAFEFADYRDITDFTATLTGEEEPKSVVLAWVGTDADYYEIYRSADGNEKELIYTTDDCTTVSYTDETIEQGVTYVYSVKPVKEGKLCAELFSSEVLWAFPAIETVTFELYRVEGKEAVGEEPAEPAGIRIAFEGVENAATYEILRKSGEDEFTVIATLEANEENTYSYLDSEIERDISYTYTVRGVKEKYPTEYNEDGRAITLFTTIEGIAPTAELVDAEEESKNVVVTWEAVENATYYYLEKKTGDGEWETVDVQIGSDVRTYTDTNIEQGVTYCYRLRVIAPDRATNQNEIGVEIIWELPQMPE